MATKIQIRSNTLIEYYQSENRKNGLRVLNEISEARKNAIENFKNCETYTGLVTNGSKKRLTRALELLVQLSRTKFSINPRTGSEFPYDLVFITLTIHFPDYQIKGKEAHKKLLEPMLLWLKRRWGVENYVWKAELQKRGQLHYHITCDKYVDKDELRNKFNELQRENGFLEAFYEKFGHYNPVRATDVHSVRNKSNIVSYLKKCIFKTSFLIGKEMAKEKQNLKSIYGKIWDCSLNLKSCKCYAADLLEPTYREINRLVLEKKVKKIESERCIIYDFIDKKAYTILKYEQKLEYFDHLERIRKYERKSPVKFKFIPEIPKPPPQLSLFS